MKKLLTAALASIGLTLVAVPATAAAATPAPALNVAAPVQPRFCSVLVGKVDAGKDSPMLAQSCSNSSQAAADRSLQSSMSSTRASATMTALMVWYDLAGYKGTSTVIYGNAGDCDGGGYRIIPDQYWESHMSSIVRANSCDAARITNFDLNAASTYSLSLYDLGYYSNNVGKVQVYSTFR